MYRFARFSGGKWNGLESDLAYVTRLSKTFSGIHRAPLYMKTFSKFKWKTKHVENGTL